MNLNQNTSWDRSFKHPVREFVLEMARVALLSLVIILPVRYWLMQPFIVRGESMETNFFNGDYLIINEASIKVLKEEPERGNVVVFRYPKDPRQFFIKRVIGLPGEDLQITDGHVVISNAEHPRGIALDESAYLGKDVSTVVSQGEYRVTLGHDEYFVMGDNRGQSLDSRIFGPIHYDDIVGKTWIRGFPLQRIRIFDTPSYNF